MGVFDKEFHRDIVDNNCAENGEQIFCKLLIARDMRCTECHISIKPKACEECYRKDKHKREDMWRDDHKAQVDKLLGDDKVVEDKVPNRIQGHIYRTTSPVAEDLSWNKSLYYGDVEQVYNLSYQRLKGHYLLV